MVAVQEMPTQASSGQTDQSVDVSAPSRREFLYYIWGASIAMVIGEIIGASLWFAYPRFRAGEFGGGFKFDPTQIPERGGPPRGEPAIRIWMSHLEDDSLVVLYNVCTHLGCLYKWVDTNNRFECPCHGSKFQKSGLYISGPAPRSLDRFVMTITFDDGSQVTTNDAGDPIPLAEHQGRTITDIAIDTGRRILRPGKV
ncbi:MAG: Rieske 2Fe-2S domain-containing protein [Anaerolineae bacterium]|nr:Rieske 2Fe-2S domain-containing protein [Anaerolineae bacterium]